MSSRRELVNGLNEIIEAFDLVKNDNVLKNNAVITDTLVNHASIYFYSNFSCFCSSESKEDKEFEREIERHWTTMRDDLEISVCIGNQGFELIEKMKEILKSIPQDWIDYESPPRQKSQYIEPVITRLFLSCN